MSDPGEVRRWLVSVVVLGGLLAGCETSDAPVEDPAADGSSTGGQTAGERTGPVRSPSGAAPGGPTDAATPSPPRTGTPAEPARFRRARAMATVRWLAAAVGPREATTPAYRRAARGVASRMADLGYVVRRQRLRVPQGVSWGVPVPAGRTWNVVATPEGLRPHRPHVLVGAHLDTVPQAPGAEDNASGVAVLLELARLVSRDGARLPVVFAAFAAEEPRGDGDARHHFGSRVYVNRMSPRQRRGLTAMVSLDRVGVGTVVPVCTGGLSPLRVRAQLVRAARAVDVPVRTCADNTSSDHWQFEQAGEAAARLGSTPYAAYHSPDDVPSVVSPAQIGRVGRVAWEWLSG